MTVEKILTMKMLLENLFFSLAVFQLAYTNFLVTEKILDTDKILDIEKNHNIEKTHVRSFI